jgi:hypothetical protein
MICNITEASLHLGFRSRSTLQRLVAKGHLEAYLRPSDGREVLLQTEPPGLPSLRETVQGLTQYRPGSPLWRQERHRPLAQLSDEALAVVVDRDLSDEALAATMAPIDAWIESQQSPDWADVAEQLNAYLGDSWPAPPWSGDQAATVAMCLSLAQEAAGGG